MSGYQPKFIADAMLGRLAKRLRLMGFDVLYDTGLDDNGIIQRSLEQDRIILTRDSALASRPLAARCRLIRSERIDGQLNELRTLLPTVEAPPLLTRCSLCNTLLDAVSRQDVRDQVPDQVLRTQNVFLRCGGCGRVYWKGSHVERMTDPTVVKQKGRPGGP